jgi:hypothetical protein
LAEGMKVDPKKIEAITKWSATKTITSLHVLLRLIGYYRRFVKNYVENVAPLTTLLKKDAFGWNYTAKSCFNKMKALMTSTPVLVAPDFTKTFVTQMGFFRNWYMCDAYGIKSPHCLPELGIKFQRARKIYL